jgi:hypothetical protein
LAEARKEKNPTQTFQFARRLLAEDMNGIPPKASGDGLIPQPAMRENI